MNQAIEREKIEAAKKKAEEENEKSDETLDEKSKTAKTELQIKKNILSHSFILYVLQSQFIIIRRLEIF